MKTIRGIQYERVRTLYQELARLRGMSVSTDLLGIIYDEIAFNTSRAPLSGGYRPAAYEVMPTASLNTELGLIRADAETIFEYLKLYHDRLDEMTFVFSVWNDYAKARLAGLLRESARLLSPTFVKGFTEELDLAGIVDRDESTAEVSEDGSISLALADGNIKKKVYTDRDISVIRIGDTLTASVIGTVTDIMNPGSYNGLLLSLSGSEAPDEAGFKIDIQTDIESVNLIGVHLGENTAGINVKAEVSADGSSVYTVFDSVVRSEFVDIPLKQTGLKRVILTLTMSHPNIITPDAIRYEMLLKKVHLMSARRSLSGIYQTSRIEIENEVAIVSVVAEDESSGNAGISYFASTMEDTDGEPTGFFSFVPGEATSVVPMDIRKYSLTVSPQSVNTWPDAGEKKYGSRLFNILGCGIDVETDDFAISEGVLAFVTEAGKEIELIPDSLKLYRGLGDYIKKETYIEQERFVDSIMYGTVPVEKTGWVDLVKLRTDVRELIDPEHIYDYSGGSQNRIKVETAITNYERIRVEREDGTIVRTAITDITVSGTTTYITFDPGVGAAVLDANYYYYITYITDLTSYARARGATITLDEASFVASVRGETLVAGKDFEIHHDDLAIEILKTGKYYNYFDVNFEEGTNNSPDISLSYRYEEISSTSAEYYETMVFVSMPTEVTIYPFMPTEISAGNFHRINGETVSALTSFVLETGWNVIQSTHPHKSANEYDVNSLTGVQSEAGIVIPESVSIMRPYQDSMRQVSPFALMTMDPSEGTKCFAFEDGRILVNYRPNFVDPAFLSDEQLLGEKGQDLICKKPRMDMIYNVNAGYDPLPESFLLEFSYSDAAGEKFIYLRAELYANNETSMTRLRKIGLNKYREK